MADKDQSDEYQFAELDAMNPEQPDEYFEQEDSSEREKRRGTTEPNVKRNVFIVVVLVILAMVLYRSLSGYFSGPKTAPKRPVAQAPVRKVEPAPKPLQSVAPAVPLVPAEPIKRPTPKVEQKLSTLELNQQNMRSDVASVNNQLGQVSSEVTSLTNQVAQLNQLISALTEKIDEQSQDIDRLMIRTKPKRKVRRVTRKIRPQMIYYVQAVIPGRAWLIAQNGSTLTVREGTNVPGYGIVKLIDPQQGRVTTSSGRVIKFSQGDS